METVAPLVRAIVRAFYPDKFAVVIEPLLRDPLYLEDDELPTGPLSEKFAGLSSTSVRRVLGILLKHSIIHKKEILTENVRDDDMDASTSGRESKVWRSYYYIDFVHFIKIISLRLQQMRDHIGNDRGREDVVEVPYICRNCNEVVDMMTASRLDFICETCGLALEDLMLGDAAASGKASTQAKAAALNAKFSEQIMAERDQRDQRDGIVEYLKAAHNLGPQIPVNDISRKLRDAATERRRMSMLQNNNREGLLETGDAVAVISTRGSDGVATELAPWLRNTVTGELTEDAIRDEEERESKRSRVDNARTLDRAQLRKRDDNDANEYERRKLAELEAAQAISAEAPVAPPPVSNLPALRKNFDAMFNFRDGGSIRAGDITEDNLQELSDRCHLDEYDAFVKFLRENTEWDI